MMADVFVKVTTIDDIQEHTNADALEIAIIGGWQVIVKKGQYQPGEIAIHVPPDVVIPEAVSNAWGVTNYLSNGRVRAARLRGEMSYGFLVDNDIGAEVGEDVQEHYGIFKWEPPEEITNGTAEKYSANFPIFTKIQRYNNFPGVIEEGEEVICSEKLHGTNSRIGMVLEDGKLIPMVGSHKQRKSMGEGGLYELPWTLHGEGIQTIFHHMALEDGTSKWDDEVIRSFIVYGELFGGKIQDLRYGTSDVQFMAYDIAINDKYLDYDHFVSMCNGVNPNIPIVPVLYRGPFNKELLEGLSMGNTTLMDDDPHIREGIVVKTVTEQTHVKVGRKVLKMINPDYETRKHGTERH